MGKLVIGSVKVAEVNKGERGDVRLKLPLVRPLQGRVAGKVQWQELHQGREPFRGELPLHISEVAWDVRILNRCYTEQ